MSILPPGWRLGKHMSPNTEFKLGHRSPRYLPIGTRKIKQGHWWIKVAMEGHQDSNWVAEHWIIAEQMLGRPLRDDEHVHHINCNKQDNTPSNLYICTNSKHRKAHSFEPLVKELMLRGYVGFDAMKGEYYVKS